jgi:2-polyprenyl-6-methoxyphenol hydroxylase-like FAD-dependent oxidoreductase
MRTAGAGISLAPNAMRVLGDLGVANDVVRSGWRQTGLHVFDAKGRPLSMLDTVAAEAVFGAPHVAIHRRELHRILANAVQPGTVHYGWRACGVEPDDGRTAVLFEDGSRVAADCVVVADGIGSRLRAAMLPASTPRYAGYTCWRGIAPWSDAGLLPATETWGPRGRVGIVPVSATSVYWFAVVDAPAGDATMRSMDVASLAERFSAYHHPISAIMAATPDDALIHGDISDIAPLDRLVHGNLVLLGDAAHATTPNLGQGACQAIEDAAVLSTALAESADIPTALRRYDHTRQRRVADVITTSRRIGAIAQTTNPVAAVLRDTIVRWTPPGVSMRRLARFYDQAHLVLAP